MEVVLIICIAVICLWFMSILIDWLYGLRMGDHFIKFEEFKLLYEINSDNWELTESYVKYIKNPNSLLPKIYWLKFTFIDFLKYRDWESDMNKRHERSKASKEYQEFREAIAQDLEKIKE